MLEEWAEEVEEAPPPPDKAEYVFDSEEDRDFHRSLQVNSSSLRASQQSASPSGFRKTPPFKSEGRTRKEVACFD
jgi:hypothetical protein